MFEAVKKGEEDVADAYQSTTVPVPDVALNVTVPSPQLHPWVTTGADGDELL